MRKFERYGLAASSVILSLGISACSAEFTAAPVDPPATKPAVSKTATPKGTPSASVTEKLEFLRTASLDASQPSTDTREVGSFHVLSNMTGVYDLIITHETYTIKSSAIDINCRDKGHIQADIETNIDGYDATSQRQIRMAYRNVPVSLGADKANVDLFCKEDRFVANGATDNDFRKLAEQLVKASVTAQDKAPSYI